MLMARLRGNESLTFKTGALAEPKSPRIFSGDICRDSDELEGKQPSCSVDACAKLDSTIDGLAHTQERVPPSGIDMESCEAIDSLNTPRP